MSVENHTKIANFPTARVFNAPAEGFSLEFRIVQVVPNASVIWLSGGRESFKIGLVILIQYRL